MPKSKSEAEIKVRVKRNPRRAFRKIIIFVIGFYVLFLTYGFVRTLVVTRLAKAEQVQLGVIQNTVPANGVLVRSEKVVQAPRTGVLKVLASEGERVRVGEVVAQVIVGSIDSTTGEKTFNIQASQAGIISYHLDELEEIYSPLKIRELDLGKAEKIESKPKQYSAGNQVEEGKPVLKIVNNLGPLYIITSLTDGRGLPNNDKKSLMITFGPDGKNVSQVVVVERNFRGKVNQLLLSLTNYNENLMVSRQLDFNIITDRFEGYIIPAAAIVRKDGKDGIFTVFKERVRWKKVEICGRAEGKVSISGITPDIKIILNPEYVKEGYPFELP